MKPTELTADGKTISINHDRCSGTGMCRETIPELFEVDSYAWLNPEFDLANSSVEKLEEAAEMCPWFAITVTTTS